MTSNAIPLKHIPIKGEIVIDLNKAFSMQTFYETIQNTFPKDPNQKIVGIAIPIINAECKGLGIIDPIGDIKDALSDLYDYSMKMILKPIWDLLGKIMDVLKRVFDFVLDYKLPILNLTIPDLFAKDFNEKLKAMLSDLWKTSKQKLEDLLKLIGVPWPIRKNISDPEKELEQVVASVKRSLWAYVIKMITKIVGLIQQALTLWDAIINKGATIWGTLWKALMDSVLGKILDLLINPPTMEQIKDWIIEFAKKVWNKAVVTYEEIMKVIEDFKLPILNIRPYDWKLPLNPHLKNSELDFQKMLIDIKTWINTYVINIIKKFIEEAIKIIKAIFSIDLSLPVLKIPLTLCAIDTVAT
jgi:hypothetical protein